MKQPATPHARGSTLGLAFALRCSTGYPACAGIDPNAYFDFAG